jgi:hypothetical protein
MHVHADCVDKQKDPFDLCRIKWIVEISYFRRDGSDWAAASRPEEEIDHEAQPA